MKYVSPPTSVTGLLSSLSDLVRLRILRLVEGQELSVGEVAKVVQLPQSTVSRHLRILAEAGWLIRRSEGTATLYRLLADELSPPARALWVTVREQLSDSADFGADQRRLRAVLAERRVDSQAFFGRVAGEWDGVRDSLFGRGFTPLAMLPLLPRDWHVADIGCGTGNAAELLAPHVDRVYAVDVSEPMLEGARGRLAGRDNVRFLLGTAESLPLEDASVDAVVCVLVLHHIDDPSAALAEFARVLRTDRGGGVVLLVDMVAHNRAEFRHTMGHKHMGFSHEHVRDLADSAGFACDAWRDLPSDPEAKGPGLFTATLRLRGGGNGSAGTAGRRMTQ